MADALHDTTIMEGVSASLGQELAEQGLPDMERVAVIDTSAGLKRVSSGEADAMVVNLTVATYYIQILGLTNSQVVGDTGDYAKCSLDVHKDWAMLAAL